MRNAVQSWLNKIKNLVAYTNSNQMFHLQNVDIEIYFHSQF